MFGKTLQRTRVNQWAVVALDFFFFFVGGIKGAKSKKLPKMADFCHIFLLKGTQVGGDEPLTAPPHP